MQIGMVIFWGFDQIFGALHKEKSNKKRKSLPRGQGFSEIFEVYFK